ncbi:MAG: DNA primase [Candidatus Neomarinimicrobiota bacterium]
MPQIPQGTVDIIRESSDILEVISQYVDLKQRGANYFGICPFHDEKTPSFSVAPSKQIYHCFGCNSGGNVFSFIMDYQKISFPEAVKFVADRYNIKIEFEKNNFQSEKYTGLYELHNIAMQLYQDNLFSEEGSRALDYLYERGLSEDIIKQFKIGFAKDRWDHLVNKVKGEGFTKSQINQSGLFTLSDKGVFDRFRSRIMFPIFHPSGKIIAFGGRIFNSDDPAKYLNSPETPLYHKGSVFYGIQATRDSIRKNGCAVLVEGYMDFLKLYQGSVFNILAISGTAFTKKHVSSLNRITKKVILVYDGDDAGANAAIKAGWTLLQGELDPMVIRPPKGLDPDDWIDKVGAKNIIKAFSKPESYIDFNIKFHEGKELEGADRKEYIIQLAKEIKNIKDGIVRNDLIRIISSKLMIEEKDLIRMVKTQRIVESRTIEENFTENDTINFTSKIEKAQFELIKLMLNSNNQTKKHIEESISEDLLTVPLLKKIYEMIKDKNLPIESSSIIEYFKDKNEREFITKMFFETVSETSIEEIVFDCLKILKSDPIKQQISDIRVKIREKESKGENSFKELTSLAELRKKLNDL